MKNRPDDRLSSEIAQLQKPIAGRRLLSWFLFLLFLIIFLVLPVVARIWSVVHAHNSAEPEFKPMLAMLSSVDDYWNPGHLSTVHQPWASNCKACHSVPFVRVQDQDCLACHKNIKDHVSRTGLKLDELNDVRCATCHREHKGEFGLAEQNKGFVGKECAVCHANLKLTFPKTKTENVSDFSASHPDFQLQITIGAAPTVLERIRQTDNSTLSEENSLKFPHDVHLAANGVRSPEGKVILKCDSCHKPDSNGKSFLPVTMKENCQSCHALKFDLAAPDREVPHGAVDPILSTLREFYSYVSVNGVPLTKQEVKNPIFTGRPGDVESVKTFIHDNKDVRSHAIASATELFEKTSCVICHEVTRVSGHGKSGTPAEDMPEWKITPVSPAHAWMPKAEFDHSKHRSSECTQCHAARTSHKATDVLMPGIKQCRECHVGEKPVANKVTSDCGLCHGFHLASFSSASALAPLHHPTSLEDEKK